MMCPTPKVSYTYSDFTLANERSSLTYLLVIGGPRTRIALIIRQNLRDPNRPELTEGVIKVNRSHASSPSEFCNLKRIE
jgi:hypothetical protein